MGTQLAVEWSSRSGITWIPPVNLEWVTESNTGARWLRGHLVDYIGENRFAISTDEAAGSYVNWGLDLAVQWPDRWSALVNYETLWGVREMSSSSLMGGIRMEF